MQELEMKKEENDQIYLFLFLIFFFIGKKPRGWKFHPKKG